jgi:hypothetical protein
MDHTANGQRPPVNHGADRPSYPHIGTHKRMAMIMDEAPAEGLTLGDILASLKERAFGFFLLLLALPCCLPFIYGLPQVVSLPMLFVSAQLVFGRSAPWLPASLSDRLVTRRQLDKVLTTSGPAFRLLERFVRPRLLALSTRPLDRLVGASLTLFSLSILLPVPLTNTVPGIAVAIAAVGLIERDGLLVLAGLVVGFAWIALLSLGGAHLFFLLLGYLQS